MSWIILVLAGLFEIVWASAMKFSNGFTRPIPTGIMLVGMVLSFWLLATAMRSLPLGTAYAIWVGVGVIGSFGVGIFVLSEPVTVTRIAGLGLIVAGIGLMAVAR